MRFPGFGRLAAVFALLLALLAAPALAQAELQTPALDETPWQTVITRQIEAFRHGDAPEAFAYAGAGFQQSYPDAFAFFRTIIGSGYAPIMESTSHSFGEFALDEESHGVFQVVKLVGKSQELYEAVYMLMEEPVGWRVQGVSLTRQEGVGI